jgi:tRNA-uridine 2-sulfurtransferase
MLNSLGFAKPESKTRVVVAMSGGVDSSVVAAMLHAQGYEVIGITLQLYDFGAALKKAGACCAGTDIADARAVAARLGIAHYVLDYESRFRDAVMEDFADTYLAGATPIPCVRCNQRVKFHDLLTTARDLSADCLATGHYLQRNSDGHLLRAADPARDQSYFLFATTQAQADFLRFPLGHMLKPAVRALAEQFELVVADKPDSQDICFVPQGRYVDVVQRLRPGAAESGEIVHIDGRVLGAHKGIIFFTVGQRKGLDIGGLAEPLYVVKLDATKRQVVVGPKQALEVASATLKELNWLGPPDATTSLQRLLVKVRSAAPPVAADVQLHADGTAEVRFIESLAGVSPGQACVFYAGERLLGGGWIGSAHAATANNTLGSVNKRGPEFG